MKKFIYIFVIIFVICFKGIIHAEDIKNIYDQKLMIIFKSSGIDLTRKQTEDIYLVFLEYASIIEPIKEQLKNIDNITKNELMKYLPDRKILKDLIYKKKEHEALIDYFEVECDLKIINLLTDNQIKKLKMYRISNN